MKILTVLAIAMMLLNIFLNVFMEKLLERDIINTTYTEVPVKILSAHMQLSHNYSPDYYRTAVLYNDKKVVFDDRDNYYAACDYVGSFVVGIVKDEEYKDGHIETKLIELKKERV